MSIPLNCIPCPAPVRHVARHFHHHVLRPIGRHVHHVAHHAPRIIAYGCCAAAVGGLGGALVAPPGGYFPQAAAASTPAPGGYGGSAGYGAPGFGAGGSGGGAPQGWPETPAYSGGMGGAGGILGGGAVPIPTYSNARPELLNVQPNVYSSTLSITPIATHATSVPEPSSLALLLLPLAVLPVLRRRG